MRILFMGTAELAAPCLETLASLPGHSVVGVITQPDRPKGRDLKPSPPPVKVAAERLGLPVQQPVLIREAGAVAALRVLQPDLIAVVAYGQLLPREILELPAHGCINVHTSLLPRWRGAAPIQYAILHGDPVTGVTTMHLNEQMDAGDIILQRVEPIRADDTSGKLHDRLAGIGAFLLAETVQLLAAGRAPRLAQDGSQITFAKKLTKEDGRVDWQKPAVEIERQIRAFDPWPGAYTFLGEKMLKVWRAEVLPGREGVPGQITAECVLTGAGGLRLVEVQPAGGKRMAFEAFRRGHQVEVGAVLR
jgi:methionyl-tRNA formyltransferase